MGALSGPSVVAKNGQVTVPKHILTALGWQPGIQVMFRVSDEDPDVLTVLPYEVAERRYERGESIEKMKRMTSLPGPTEGATT